MTCSPHWRSTKFPYNEGNCLQRKLKSSVFATTRLNFPSRNRRRSCLGKTIFCSAGSQSKLPLCCVFKENAFHLVPAFLTSSLWLGRSEALGFNFSFAWELHKKTKVVPTEADLLFEYDFSIKAAPCISSSESCWLCLGNTLKAGGINILKIRDVGFDRSRNDQLTFLIREDVFLIH